MDGPPSPLEGLELRRTGRIRRTLRRAAKPALGIALATAGLVASYQLGKRAGPQAEREALTALPAAEGFLSHAAYALKVTENDKGATEMYFQNRETGDLYAISDQTIRMLEAYEDGPRIMHFAIGVASDE